ncbi:MAG: hypothetical protein NTW49_09525 [Bacteroidia bacterium]|nr:hypothetical protein [Bacteroidia bacterium]
MCNYTDCWFCCIDDETGQIVDCKTGLPIEKCGTVEVDTVAMEGTLTIELNPKYDDQKNAINNALTLYIDDDLSSNLFTILKGEYQFDDQIGKYGGYLVPVTMK